MRDDAAPGPLTQASAPLSGSPRNRQILWGETAPGRLGREDARNFRDWTLMSEVAPAGHHHRDPGRVRGRDHLVILHRAAPLDGGGDAGIDPDLKPIWKRKERV